MSLCGVAAPIWRVTALHQATGGVVTVRCLTRAYIPSGARDFVLVLASEQQPDRVCPLTSYRTGAELVIEARLDLREPPLCPGWWDVFIRQDGGTTRLLAPLHGHPLWPMLVDVAGGPYKITPVVTRRGAVRLRVSRAQPHAEVDRVELDGAILTVDAHPVPEHIGAGGWAELVARPRDGDVAVVRFPVRRQGNRMRARVDLAALPVPGPDMWDLYVELGQARWRLASRLDEIPDKKAAYSFPSYTAERGDEVVTLQPCYAFGRNGLSIRVDRVDVPVVAEAVPRPQRGSRGPLARAAVGTVLAGLERVGRWRRPLATTGTRPRVAFVVTDVSYGGGIARTVINLANHLALDHDVEIISLLRYRDRPFFRIDPGVRLTCLVDRPALCESPQRGVLPWLRARLLRRASWLVPPQDPESYAYSLWLDLKLLRRLHSLEPGVLVTSRLPFSVIAARFARAGVRTVGQEHMTFSRHGPALRRQLHAHFRKLAAVTVLTSGDEADYREALAGSATQVVRIPNAVPEQPPVRADLAGKRVIAMGRYTWQKGFDLLIDTFRQVVAVHPDWQLRLFGHGPGRALLRQRIREAGLHNHVLLMGRTDHPADEMAQAAIFVLSSRYEGFGMVLIEALAVGLPVVSFDCPRGPSDIITPGVDGMLVPPQDVDALAAAIIDLIENPAKRRSYSDAALHTATRYDIEVVGKAWRQLISELLLDLDPATRDSRDHGSRA